MVVRKPVAQSGITNAIPPYPITPLEEHPPALPTSQPVYSSDLNQSPAFNLKTLEEAKKDTKADDSDPDSSEDDWNQSDDEDFETARHHDVPNILKPAGDKLSASTSTSVPGTLRAGPPAGVPINIKPKFDKMSPMPTGDSVASSLGGRSTTSSNGSGALRTNNPYLQMQQTGQSNWGGENTQAIWGEGHGHPQQHNRRDNAVELPTAQIPIAATAASATSFSSPQRSHSIDQPPLIVVDSSTPVSVNPPDTVIINPWAPAADVSSLDVGSRAYGLPDNHAQDVHHRSWQEQQAWEQSERERRQKDSHAAREAALRAEKERRHEEEFHRLDQQSRMPQVPPPPIPNFIDELPPALPPRKSLEEEPLFAQSQPVATTSDAPRSAPAPESPNTVMNNQRKEHYHIKQIRWFDFNKRGMRTSPIITQNLNGPCPLLALVNALILSTPAGMETALVETLRARETVSLGLLLDAVFDELMSGRRGDAAQALPDVSELYKFLLALHMGLHVNPMFVLDREAVAASTTLTNLAGGFENTQDMKLYRTFDVPLMHGWLPESSSEAWSAFDRVAKSYETSQYVQFQEEELEAKLQSGAALTTGEQQMFTDIHAIKAFLDRWQTQLTDHGLKVMRSSLQDGQFAILFRNDHFSTICKDPRTGVLVTLVTDQGYSTHEEIVWESLIDVTGQGSQLFSGDFRSVDNSNAAMKSHHGNHVDLNTPAADLALSEPSRAEQEDHDLALALQLQEEEEDRQRRQERENQLSFDAMIHESQAQAQSRPARANDLRPPQPPRPQQNPTLPPRRNNVTTHRPQTEAAPPPTYEEASTAPRFNPPAGHPASAQAPLDSQQQQGTQGNAYQGNISGNYAGRPMPGGMSGRYGRRQSGQGVGEGMGQGHGHDERDKCFVM